jgi:hypothetical protein
MKLYQPTGIPLDPGANKRFMVDASGAEFRHRRSRELTIFLRVDCRPFAGSCVERTWRCRVNAIGVPAPFRGQYGECPPIDVRYACLDEKMRDAALAGNLAPEKLSLLLDPTSDNFAPTEMTGEYDINRSPATGNLRTATARATKSSAMEKFVKAIPIRPLGFLVAWSILIDLISHDCGEPESASHIQAALG